MVNALDAEGISGGRVPKLSFFGDTPGFLIFTDGLSEMVCSDAAGKSTNAETKSNSDAPATAIARANDLKRIVNKQSPFRAHVFTRDSIPAQAAQAEDLRLQDFPRK